MTRVIDPMLVMAFDTDAAPEVRLAEIGNQLQGMLNAGELEGLGADTVRTMARAPMRLFGIAAGVRRLRDTAELGADGPPDVQLVEIGNQVAGLIDDGRFATLPVDTIRMLACLPGVILDIAGAVRNMRVPLRQRLEREYPLAMAAMWGGVLG